MWIFYALLAASLWGLNYVFAEKVLGKISAFTFLTFGFWFAALIFTIGLFFTDFRSDVHTLWHDKKTLGFFLIGETAFLLGNVFIVSSIQSSNATWASLIEISYPLFIIIFTWLIFRENHLSLPVIIGGALIFLGVGVISYFK